MRVLVMVLMLVSAASTYATDHCDWFMGECKGTKISWLDYIQCKSTQSGSRHVCTVEMGSIGGRLVSTPYGCASGSRTGNRWNISVDLHPSTTMICTFCIADSAGFCLTNNMAVGRYYN